jgi:hypothetical protein
MMANDAPIPSVVAMLVCDQIINEEGTNKKSLIGVFETVNAVAFPLLIARLAVYVKLVDALGSYSFKVRLVNLRDESLVVQFDIQANISDASHHSELALNMGNVPIPEPGRYEFQLYHEDIFLHRVTMDANQIPGGVPW